MSICKNCNNDDMKSGKENQVFLAFRRTRTKDRIELFWNFCDFNCLRNFITFKGIKTIRKKIGDKK